MEKLVNSDDLKSSGGNTLSVQIGPRGPKSMITNCSHINLTTTICDQTLGISCIDCNQLLAWCWNEHHIPESMWNRACQNDPEAVSRETNRDDYCALCCEEISTIKKTIMLNAMWADSDGILNGWEGETLEELQAELINSGYNGPCIEVRDKQGFIKGWANAEKWHYV